MPEFIIENADAFRRVEIDGDEVVLGRDPGCDLVLDEASVSRRHARVVREGGRWILEDLGSGNGTLLDGVRVARARIARGAVIALGAARVTFLGAADDAPDEPGPAAVAAEPEPRAPGRAGAPAAGVPQPLDGAEAVEPPAGLADAVFLGHQPLGPAFEGRRDGRRVRMVRVLPRLVEDVRFAAWLESSVEAWNRPADPGCIPVAVERDPDGSLHLIDEIGGGRDLAGRLGAERRLEQIDVAHLGVQTVGILKRRNAAGVRIWGARPSCVVQDEGGAWRLAFCGIPFHLAPSLDPRGVDELRHLPPEAFGDAARLGPQSDVYGLGAVLHAALIGLPVADGRSAEAVRASVERGGRKHIEQRAPRLVEDLAPLLLEMLAPEPADRPDVEEVAERLAAISGRAATVRRKGAAIAVEEREREVGERPAPPKKSLRYRMMSWGATGAIFVVLNGLLITAFVLFSPGGCDTIPPDPYEGPDPDAGRGATSATARPGGLPERVDALIDGDRFDEAGSLIMGALRRGELGEAEAQDLRQRIRSGRERRALELTETVEKALAADDVGMARVALRRLARLVGSKDPGYLRLADLVEAH